MMIGRFNNMDIADEWREQELNKVRKERRFWIVALIVSVAALIVTYPHMSWADSITFDGRTEQASCHYETQSQPDMGLAVTAELCESESWICKIQGGSISCETKR